MNRTSYEQTSMLRILLLVCILALGSSYLLGYFFASNNSNKIGKDIYSAEQNIKNNSTQSRL